MIKQKKDRTENYLLIILVVALVSFLIVKTPFMGSLYLNCNNFEPKTFNELTSKITSFNGVITASDAFIIQTSEGVQTHATYETNSKLGDLYVIPLYAETCDSFLKKVNENPFHQDNLDFGRSSDLACSSGYAIVEGMCQYNVCWPSSEGNTIFASLNECNSAASYTTTNYISLERRQVLNTQAGYMFCNYENNIALLAPSLSEFNAYVSEFEVCVATEPREEQNDPLIEDDEGVGGSVSPSVPATIPGEDISGEDGEASNNSKLFNAVLVSGLLLLLGFFIFRKISRGRK